MTNCLQCLISASLITFLDPFIHTYYGSSVSWLTYEGGEVDLRLLIFSLETRPGHELQVQVEMNVVYRP